MQRRRRESEEENAGQELLSSLDDVNTDEEMEDNNSVHESKQDGKPMLHTIKPLICVLKFKT